MIDPNNDIVPTLRMFDGLMMNIAADEIEMLRARVKDLEARAAAHAQPIGEDAANGAMPDCTCGVDTGGTHNEACPVTHAVRHLFTLSGENASANGAIGEREAFEEAFRRNFEFPEHADQFTFRKGWEAGIMQARAALTAEKVAAEPVAGEIQAFEAWFKTSGFWTNATMCEEVMEQSRNSLFRSAAKICAGLIRAGRKAQCDLPPEGWYCTRDKGHEGPCAAYATEQQPAQSAEQDERAQLDVSVLARLSAQIFDCPLNPTISKFARAVEANVRAASTQSTATQPALTAQSAEDAYSVWEKAPDYCPYNKRGFGAGYRAGVAAAQPASGGKHE
jgi:hypothetical protein